MKAVIFDFGGVVVKDTGPEAEGLFCEVFGINLDTYRKISDDLYPLFQLGDIDEETFWARFSLATGRPLPADYMKLFMSTYRSEFNQDVLDAIARLQDTVKLGCISNTIQPHALYHRSRGHYDMFDEVVLSCEVGLRKPDRRIFELMCARLGVKGQDCVFVDDKEEYMGGAKELGMRCMKYPCELKVLC